METWSFDKMEECAREIANDKAKTLLKMYANKVNSKQTDFASGMKFAMKCLNVVTNEEIKTSLNLTRYTITGNREIAKENVDQLLCKYVENLKSGKKKFAFGIRFVALFLGVVTDEEIHYALTGKTVKKKTRNKKRK